jgi:hypothetical protein
LQPQYIAQKSIPRLTVLLEGVRQNKAPKEPEKPRGQLTLRLNGIVKSFFPLQPRNDPAASSATVEDDGDTDDDMDGEDEDSESNLLEQVNKLMNENVQDSEDGPDYMFDVDETVSPDPDYVFCPATHRKQILHLFTKHFCQHPIFPERHEKSLDTNQIRREAVFDMYDFCKKRGLREVWGYIWACWYSPKMWKLWARSTSTYLSRLRTTMGVENFWRQLKHNYLHHVARPRLDHLVWILIYKVTPSYFARTQILDNTHRLGRSKSLTTYQRAFKTSWLTLMKKDIRNKPYTTDVRTWTCNCGQQKYHCHHLCKHLVQAVGLPDKRFFRTVVRRRVVPIYQHPLLVLKGSTPGEYVEPDGAITDGDDNEWSGDKKLLKGSNGGWKELVGTLGSVAMVGENVAFRQSKKRRQENVETEEQNQETDSPKRRRHTEPEPEPEVIDLTMSSPVTEQCAFEFDNLESIPERSSSVGFDYGSADEHEVN